MSQVLQIARPQTASSAKTVKCTQCGRYPTEGVSVAAIMVKGSTAFYCADHSQ